MQTGQLGDGTEVTRLHPVQVTGTWNQLATADEWTCGVHLNGTAACWGQAYGDTPAAAGGPTTWRTLDLGVAHACGLRPDGSAWCFGENYYGQLGDGTTTRRLSAVPVTTPASGYF
jgi:alpha-tubulin suppressor-like RCC1 family protein